MFGTSLQLSLSSFYLPFLYGNWWKEDTPLTGQATIIPLEMTVHPPKRADHQCSHKRQIIA
jgi:hypothetical protein